MSKQRVTFGELKKRLDRLATSLLPPDRLNGDYTDEDRDRIHAYVVLAHAELENYIEKLAIFAADQAKRKSNSNHCEPVSSRLIFFRAISGRDKIDVATPEAISSAYAYFEKLTERNHGIKSNNLLQLFMPLGLTHNDFDPVFLANLDAFGILRGEVAHTAARLKQGSSPSAEKAKIIVILNDLSHFDQRVRQLI